MDCEDEGRGSAGDMGGVCEFSDSCWRMFIEDTSVAYEVVVRKLDWTICVSSA